MKIVIFTGGIFTKSTRSQHAINEADMIIAADSGADTAVSQGVYPSIVIGDMDSIHDETRQLLLGKDCHFISRPSQKDETDTELALELALEKEAKHITLLGGTEGDRFDHIISNLLYVSTLNRDIVCFHHNQKIWVAQGPQKITIDGNKHDLLSLIPLHDDILGITTEGLFYPLHNETLRFGKPRGVSNILTQKTATVAFQKGALLFVHTLKQSV